MSAGGRDIGHARAILAGVERGAQLLVTKAIAIFGHNRAVDIDKCRVADVEPELRPPAAAVVEHLRDRGAADQPDADLHQMNSLHRSPLTDLRAPRPRSLIVAATLYEEFTCGSGRGRVRRLNRVVPMRHAHGDHLFRSDRIGEKTGIEIAGIER